MLKETLLTFGYNVYVLYTNHFSDVTQTGGCELVKTWIYEEPTGISVTVLREKKEGNSYLQY